MKPERTWQAATIILAIALLSTVTLGPASSSDSLSSLGQYENGELAIDFDLLPGVRINLWVSDDIVFSTEEPSHVQHGFRSTLHWSEMTPFEQTEFLSTNSFRLFYKGDEVPLRHITRYDPVEDYMWSIFYRVFPPEFFPKGVHQVRGEWTWQENSVWEFRERTGKLDVYDPNVPTVSEGPAGGMTVKGGIRLRNFGNIDLEQAVYVGRNLWNIEDYDAAYKDWGTYSEFELFLIPTSRTLHLKFPRWGPHEDFPLEESEGPWDVMQIEITAEEAGWVNLIGVTLNGYPLGDLSSGQGTLYWTVTNVDLSEEFTFTALLEIHTSILEPPPGPPELNKIDILIGTLDPPP
jgi:hypothetical protein